MDATVSTSARPAAPEDVDAVVALVESAYRGDASRAGWTTEADLLGGRRTDAAMVRSLLADPDSVLLVLPDDAGGLVGCCHVRRRPATGPAGPRTVYFGLFAVRPGVQGRGHGSRLLDAAEELAAAWGAQRLELTVLSHRPELLAWYERRGFALTGVTHPFPGYADARYGLPRRDDLTLHEMAKPLG